MWDKSARRRIGGRLTLLAIATIFTLAIVAGEANAIGTYIIPPSISVSPSPALTGQQITITGHYFNVSASTVTGSFGDGSNYQGAVIQSDGTFTITHTYLIAGTYTITAGDSKGDSATRTLTVNQGPATIIISPDTVAYGKSLRVTCYGFKPQQQVTVTGMHGGAHQGMSSKLAQFNANATGIMDCTIPMIYPDLIALKASDGTSTTSAVPVTVIPPTLTVSPNPGTNGQYVTFTGNGYIPGHGVTLKCDGLWTNGGAPVALDSSGGFTVTSTAIAVGTFPLTVYDENNYLLSTTSLTIVPASTPVAKISLSPNPATIGGQVTITGSVTPAGTVKSMVLYKDGQSTGIPIDILQNGNINTVISTSVITNHAGTYDVYLVTSSCHSNDVSLTVTEPMAYAPSISVSPNEITAGEAVQITGQHFNPAIPQGKTYDYAHIFFNGNNNLDMLIQSDGTISYPYSQLAAGSYTIYATDDWGEQTAPVQLTVNPAQTSTPVVTPVVTPDVTPDVTPIVTPITTPAPESPTPAAGENQPGQTATAEPDNPGTGVLNATGSVTAQATPATTGNANTTTIGQNSGSSPLPGIWVLGAAGVLALIGLTCLGATLILLSRKKG